MISIHALREEGDYVASSKTTILPLFLSTPSARRATVTSVALLTSSKFLSTPSARRATPHIEHRGVREAISIHALREEGDQAAAPEAIQPKEFLSTPSARRATIADLGHSVFPREFLSTPSARRATPDPAGAVVSDQFLSTPSARRATSRSSFRSRPAAYFYPRPPRGGRRSRPTHG